MANSLSISVCRLLIIDNANGIPRPGPAARCRASGAPTGAQDGPDAGSLVSHQEGAKGATPAAVLHLSVQKHKTGRSVNAAAVGLRQGARAARRLRVVHNFDPDLGRVELVLIRTEADAVARRVETKQPCAPHRDRQATVDGGDVAGFRVRVDALQQLVEARQFEHPDLFVTDKIGRRVISGKQGTLVYWRMKAGARSRSPASA